MYAHMPIGVNEGQGRWLAYHPVPCLLETASLTEPRAALAESPSAHTAVFHVVLTSASCPGMEDLNTGRSSYLDWKRSYPPSQLLSPMDEYFVFHIYSLSSLRSSSLCLYLFLSLCFCVFPCIRQHACKGQRAIFMNWLSPCPFAWVITDNWGYQAWWQEPSPNVPSFLPKEDETFIDI